MDLVIRMWLCDQGIRAQDVGHLTLAQAKEADGECSFLRKQREMNNLWAPEKAMAPHSSTLAWKIPWTEELGRLQSMGSRRVGHD